VILPGIPRPLAARIDRLSRAAHAFHRYAHHPLCPAYAPEVFRLGRTRICLGCSLALGGGLLGTLLGASLQPASLAVLGSFAILCAFAGLPALAWPRRSPGKILTRMFPAALAAFVVLQGLLRAPDPASLALAGGVILGTMAGVILYRRRGPDRRPCETCPELPARPACAGFLPIRRRERAFRRLASDWIQAGSDGKGSILGGP